MHDVLIIDLALFPGGIALWGGLPPVYDTTDMAVERGVHVHARKAADGGPKVIDSSYPVVNIVSGGCTVAISADAAESYVAAAILGLPLKYLVCPCCDLPHLDTRDYALHPHRMHLCQGCGRLFEDAERAIGNPIVLAKALLGDSRWSPERQMKRVLRPLDIKQSDFSGGVRIWGTHPAILWTAPRGEEDGIHVHAYGRAGEESPLIDETFGAVSIDGIGLDPRAVRSFMVQQQAPSVLAKLARVICDRCSTPIVEAAAPAAIAPSTQHQCDCGHVTSTTKAVIANEMPEILKQLYESARFSDVPRNRRRS